MSGGPHPSDFWRRAPLLLAGCFFLGFAATFMIGLMLIKSGWLGAGGLPW